MEKYLITKEEKENYLKEYPVLECENSIGIDYDGYISIKCKKLLVLVLTKLQLKTNIITVSY